MPPRGEKPPDIQEDAIRASQGDDAAKERQSRRGKRGAAVRWENETFRNACHEAGLEHAREEIYEQQRRQLQEMYPERNADGEEVSEEWYQSEASKIADAIIAMRLKQRELMKKR